MDIVDLQLHEPGPLADWPVHDVLVRREALREALFQMTDAVGVTGVVLHPEPHLDFAEDLAIREPRRFCNVPLLIDRGPAGKRQGAIRDTAAPDLLEQLMNAAARPGVKGFRLMLGPRRAEKFDAGGYDHLLRCTAATGLPLFLLSIGYSQTAEKIARAYPEMRIVIDHFGVPQPPMRIPDDPWWKALPDLLKMAALPNVSVKMCGALSLSRQGHPCDDVWPKVAQVIEAFGVHRVAWASDIGRFRGVIGWERFPEGRCEYQGKHTYMESLAFYLYSDRLSAKEKEQILGGTARELLNWN